MASLREYFEKDFPNCITFYADRIFTMQGPDGKVATVVATNIEPSTLCCFFSYYIPPVKEPHNVFASLMVQCKHYVRQVGEVIKFTGSSELETVFGINEPKFWGRVYVYTENQISKEWIEKFTELAESNSWLVTIRSRKYAKAMSAKNVPQAFICHDFRDNEQIARPLALELERIGCHVWYDEFSLRVGDSLRESIEKGLREAKRCIVVLTPAFLSNAGWTKAEFNSIFTKELVEKRKVLIPIWSNVQQQDVYQYSPTLVDRLALHWSDAKSIAAEIHRAVLDDSHREHILFGDRDA